LLPPFLMLAAFLAGFLPNYIKGQRLASELREARQESAMAELRDLAGLLYLQANQKDYGLAATTSTRFFERTWELANQIPDPSRKQPLEGLESSRSGHIATGEWRTRGSERSTGVIREDPPGDECRRRCTATRVALRVGLRGLESGSRDVSCLSEHRMNGSVNGWGGVCTTGKTYPPRLPRIFRCGALDR